MDFTLTESLVYSMQERSLDWATEFLRTTNNERFAEMISLEGVFIGPIEIDLSKLKRVCGPEEHMIFKEEKSYWEDKVESMEYAIETGWDMPPIMIWFKDKEFSIADGSHRYQALLNCGKKTYWSFIWFKTNEEYRDYLENFKEN